MIIRKLLSMLVIALMVAGTVFAEEAPQRDPNNPSPISVTARYETGYIGVLNHIYRSGSKDDGNTDFNFVTQGGQEILFPYERLQVDVGLFDRHMLSFLYQPLTVDTRVKVGQNGIGGDSIQIENVLFPKDTALNIRYGFDFWRFSYMYDFIAGETFLGAGVSLQFRNASIDFTSVDGSLRAVTQDLGPVPVLKTRFEHFFGDPMAKQFKPRFGLKFEADGFYASSAFINGADFDFEGWVWDVALSPQVELVPGLVATLNLRTIGGGSSGIAGSDAEFSTQAPSRENYNSLATIIATLGATVDIGKFLK